MSESAGTLEPVSEAVPAAHEPDLRSILERLARVLEERPLAERSAPFTVDELAHRWQCDPKTVERLCTSGELKSFKPGRRRLIRPVAVARYEKAQSGDAV